MTTEPKTFPQMPSMSMCATELVWATKLQDWGRAAQAEISSLASRLEAAQALAGELAEALEDAFSWLEAQPLMDRMIDMGCPEVIKLFRDCPAALAKFRAAQSGEGARHHSPQPQADDLDLPDDSPFFEERAR